MFSAEADAGRGKFIGKHLRQRCFPVSFAKFLRTSFSHKTPRGVGGGGGVFEMRIEMDIQNAS